MFMPLWIGITRTRATLLLALMFFVGWSSALAAGESPISYRVPDSWKLFRELGDATGAHVVVYEIGGDAGAGSRPVVMIKTYKLDHGRDMSNVDVDALARQGAAGGTEFCEVSDGPHWRTYAFTGRENGARTITLYRVGMQDGYGVEEVFEFPLNGDKSEGLSLLTIAGQASQQGQTTGVYSPRLSTQKLIDQFNQFTQTLVINGKNQFDAKVMLVTPSAPPSAIYRMTKPASHAGG